MVDIDEFLTIKQMLGKEESDKVISGLAALLQVLFPKDCIIGRDGVDKFLVFVSGSKKELRAYARTISVLCQRVKQELNVSVSVGVAQSPVHGRSFQELLVAANRAMGVAKSEGKDNYQFYNASMSLRNVLSKERAGQIVPAFHHTVQVSLFVLAVAVIVYLCTAKFIDKIERQSMEDATQVLVEVSEQVDRRITMDTEKRLGTLHVLTGRLDTRAKAGQTLEEMLFYLERDRKSVV